MHVIYLKRCFAWCFADEKSDRGLFRKIWLASGKKRDIWAQNCLSQTNLCSRLHQTAFLKSSHLSTADICPALTLSLSEGVRIEVRENWCQTSSFHSHPETKWHSDYSSQSEVPRLHMHRRDVFCNQSNQASPSCGSARIRVPDEPAPFSAGSLEEVQCGDGGWAAPFIIQPQLFRTALFSETQSFQGILALFPAYIDCCVPNRFYWRCKVSRKCFVRELYC